MSLARDFLTDLKAAVAEGQVNSKIRAATSKASFIRKVLMTKEAQRVSADNKTLCAARNILNRGLRELASLGCTADKESHGLLAEVLDGGKRGRRKKSECDKSTPQCLMTCFRGKKGDSPPSDSVA